MKTERGETKLAYFDGHEWTEIDLAYQPLETFPIEWVNIVNRVQELSKRSALLHGVFVNAYCIGNVILDKPQMLFLHGVRYDIENSGLVPLEVIIENQKSGI